MKPRRLGMTYYTRSKYSKGADLCTACQGVLGSASLTGSESGQLSAENGSSPPLLLHSVPISVGIAAISSSEVASHAESQQCQCPGHPSKHLP